ncbi:PREDICTED: N-acetylserotonin O-methyltransferase-like protein [Ceratotherium simum simum]|uniref:N-acetylserotonin O-methyltransferase-like protein n=1 Tax=Ceratotherium simum simum TaxID=73337 RepID=A0ABM1DGS0_CERSS|nr:PREDICTED: N-acetylserotonin O-methyltransferase-like protein [Ceratotherium simum simum]
MVLCPVIRKLQHQWVVLASASPRRREILSQTGLRFEVVPSRFKENLQKASFPTPHAYAVETAKQKALEVACRMHQKDLRTPDIVIGADTIVTVGGLILEKPVDKQDAYSMLSRLNGTEHSVFTGVAIVHCCSTDGRLHTEVTEFYEETRVRFSELSEELLREYIDSGEPTDKAGGYGIQALGGMLVESAHGDFLNVVGFPLNRFCRELTRLYYPPPREGPQQLTHDPLPALDTRDNLSDAEGGGSDAAQSQEACGGRAEAGGERTQAEGAQEAASNRTGDGPPPFPIGLLELIDGFKASKALFTACKLKVFDLLKDETPLRASEIASRFGAPRGGVAQLLDVCVALGLLEKTRRAYSNTDLASRHLVSDVEYSLHGLVMHHNDHTWNLFSHLERAILAGPGPGHTSLGDKATHLSQNSRDQSKEATLGLLRATHGLAKLTARQVATAFDLSWFTSACHLGGCTGALAHALAREYPRLQVTVFDLPEVLEHVACFQPEGRQTEQIRFLPGDFFTESLPDADLYVLSRILSDWEDDKVHELLSRISGSCKPGGGLLLVDTVWDEEGPENATVDEARRAARNGLRRALDGLVWPPRAQRSLAEYRRLLQRHGFRDVAETRAGDQLHVLLGTRPSPREAVPTRPLRGRLHCRDA